MGIYPPSAAKIIIQEIQVTAEIVEIGLELIKKALEAGDDVLISSFGKFCVKEKAERKGRNPITGEKLLLGARRVVTFRSAGKLREKINML